MAQNPIVTIEMEDGGTIKAELYPEIAPNTVNNFISLINKGYYDGVIFHRVIPGFMIQGGDPKGMGTGGPGYSIKGEFTPYRRPHPVQSPCRRLRGFYGQYLLTVSYVLPVRRAKEQRVLRPNTWN